MMLLMESNKDSCVNGLWIRHWSLALLFLLLNYSFIQRQTRGLFNLHLNKMWRCNNLTPNIRLLPTFDRNVCTFSFFDTTIIMFISRQFNKFNMFCERRPNKHIALEFIGHHIPPDGRLTLELGNTFVTRWKFLLSSKQICFAHWKALITINEKKKPFFKWTYSQSPSFFFIMTSPLVVCANDPNERERRGQK